MPKVKPKRHKLNARQLRFVAEYVLFAAAGEPNATQAAIRAGYSKKSAYQMGAQLLKHPQIAALVAKKAQGALEKAAKAIETLDLSAQHVLEETARLAFSDIGGAFDADGTLLSVHQMPEHVRRAISSVKVVLKNNQECVEVKFWPKGPMLDLLAKYHHLIDAGAPPADPKDRPPVVIVLQAPPPGRENEIIPIGQPGSVLRP